MAMARGNNFGHGHVTPRADGVKARCGGPSMCSTCANELGQLRAAQGIGQQYSGSIGDPMNAYQSSSNASLQSVGAGILPAEPRPKDLRDEFAMAALIGILDTCIYGRDESAATAYEYADAMMKAREVKS